MLRKLNRIVHVKYSMWNIFKPLIYVAIIIVDVPQFCQQHWFHRVYPPCLQLKGYLSFPDLCGCQTSNVNQNHLGCLFKLLIARSYPQILISQVSEEAKNTHALLPPPWILIKLNGLGCGLLLGGCKALYRFLKWSQFGESLRWYVYALGICIVNRYYL